MTRLPTRNHFRRALTHHPLHSGAICIGLYCPYAKFPRTSAALDVDVRYSDVGIEPLVSLAHRHPEGLDLAGIVCNGERRYTTRDGIFSVLAGAYDHQPAQTGERHHTRDIRRLCLDTQSHVSRAVGSTLGLGHQPRHADPTCAGAAIHSAHTACTSSSGGACPAGAVRPGLCSILPASKPLVGAQKVNHPLSGVRASRDIDVFPVDRVKAKDCILPIPRMPVLGANFDATNRKYWPGAAEFAGSAAIDPIRASVTACFPTVKLRRILKAPSS
jgi:hypothetical protein